MKKTAWISLLICSTFLFYKYIAQLFPTLIGASLMQSKGYDGIMLGVMASSYYYAYSLMQMVSGYLIDRYSIKVPMFCALLVIALMMLAFSHTDNFYLMCVSRAMMGIGASFATLAYMKCAATCTTPKTFGLVSSFLATATMLGAACGGAPIAWLFDHTGWQHGLTLVGIAGLVIAGITLALPDAGQSLPSAPVAPRIHSFRLWDVLAKPDNWLLLLYSGLTFSPVVVLGGLWGTPFLMTKHGIDSTHAALALSVMFIGHAVGAPGWALLAKRVGQKIALMHFSNLAALITISLILYGHLPYTISLVLFFLFGLSVSCFMLSFTLCREINTLAVMGLAVAFMNSGEGILGSLIEPFIGYLLDLSRTGADFSLTGYEAALTVLPCCFMLSSTALFFLGRRKTATVCLPHYAGA